MNYRGSYRHLLRNAQSAMLAAIEIYTKPRLDYRDECFVILLLNAWELLLKAVLSKNKRSVFYRKKRKQPYRTFSLADAFTKAEAHFPAEVARLPVKRNLELLSTYRDNAVHFYNTDGFGSLVYALAQTSILNFRDIAKGVFGEDPASEITWQLLPLGLNPPIDPIAYISGEGCTQQQRSSSAVKQFVAELASATKEVEAAGSDTGRLLTVFQVILKSTKKIAKADVTVGVQGNESTTGPLAIVKTVDPNVSHPLRQTDIVERVGALHGRKFTSYVFQALCVKFGWKENPNLCWKASEGVLTRYSNEVLQRIKQVSDADLEGAMAAYRRIRNQRAKSA